MSAKPSPVNVGVISLGCAKNLVDTEVMLGDLERAGCGFVTDPAEADVLLVNTCSFIDAAREESIRTILDAAEYKRKGRAKRLVVAGCLVQRHREELRESLPEVDAFLGLDEVRSVVGAVRPSNGSLLSIARPSGASSATYLYDHRTPRRRATPGWTAYVKIAEGCDHTCAFCAIPSFRGSFRSRRPDSVRDEVRALARAGVREVNLIAQDSSHYGRDLGRRDGLSDLLRTLNDVDGLRWIRVHYLYPNTVNDGLLAAMGSLERVVPYVDLPLQHAHPATLRRMRRGGSADGHLRLIDRFRRALPGAAVRSTLIVGFPGETEEEFSALCDFVAEARFDHLGVFRYSHEESTPAADRTDDVPDAVKRERFDRIMQLQQGIALEHNARRVGDTVEVLVEGAHAETDHLLVGRMATQALDVDGQVILNDGVARPGDFVPVELTGTAGYDLVGRIVVGS